MSELWAHLDTAGWTRTFPLGTIGSEDIARYAGASGDVNRVHVDEAFARAAGHPALLAHGMLTMGLAGTRVAGLVGHHRLRRFGGRFLAPVHAGDALTCTVTLTDVQRSPAGTAVELLVRTATDEDIEVFRGAAAAFLSPQESP